MSRPAAGLKPRRFPAGIRPALPEAEAPLGGTSHARIVEIFASVQGEAERLGEKQIFVRFGGCNLHCDYCDEPDTIPIPSGRPMPMGEVQGIIGELAFLQGARTVSLTGGEPLLHEDFLATLLPWLKDQRLETLLETNGILPSALRRLSPWVDLVSMDLKLPSATGRETWGPHEEFLRVAPEKTFTKLVLTHRTTLEEVERAAELAAGVSRDLPLYLQPVTPIGDVRRPDPADLLSFLRAARARLRRVRLTPQWHPVWGLH